MLWSTLLRGLEDGLAVRFGCLEKVSWTDRACLKRRGFLLDTLILLVKDGELSRGTAACR